MARERSFRYAEKFARHLAQSPCDIDTVKTRTQYYLQGSGGDQAAWNPPQPLYGGETSLWLLYTALDFSRNVGNIDFVLQGLAAQQSTDSEYTAASALYSWAQEYARHPPLRGEAKVRCIGETIVLYRPLTTPIGACRVLSAPCQNDTSLIEAFLVPALQPRASKHLKSLAGECKGPAAAK